MTQGTDRICLAATLLLALALRLPVLNDPLWYDELLTLQTHVRLGWDQLLSSYSMNHHYLHNIAAKLAVGLFGESPWALRLPALLFGLGGIWVIWHLAFTTAGRAPAHATALLLALSYHHVWFSTNARGYTGLALFSTLGLVWFLKGTDSRRLGDWLIFAACLAATIFTHLTGAFFFAALGLLWLARLSRSYANGTLVRADVTLPFAGFLIGGLMTIALYAPVIPSLVETVSAVSQTSAADPMQEYQSPFWAAYEGLRTGLGSAGFPVVTVGAIALVLAIAGAFALKGTAALIGPATFVHILLTITILLVVGMRIWPRFFFTDIPLVLFLIVLGVGSVCTFLAARLPAWLGRSAFPAALLAMALISAALAARNYTAPKQDLAGAVALVEAGREPGERVYAVSYAGTMFTDHFETDWQTIWTSDDYHAALAMPGPLTIVVAFPGRNLREFPDLQRDLESGILTERADLPGTLGDGSVLVLGRAE